MLIIMKNIHFTRLVKAGSSVKEFNFRKLRYSQVPSFHVDVTDERANRIVFTMEKSDGSWIMNPINLPVWLKNTCNSLQQILEDAENEKEDEKEESGLKRSN